MIEFLHMGGDAGFVFGSYVIVMLALILGCWQAHRTERRLLRRLQSRRDP